MSPRAPVVLLALGLAAVGVGCGAARPAGFPGHWWAPVDGDAPGWEILPDAAGPGEVILSKRNELGLLSNFAPTRLTLDGAEYASVEGLWQMMFYPEGPDDPRKVGGAHWPHSRAEVAAMVSFEAKRAGRAAKAILKTLGIDWLTYGGRRLDWRGADRADHEAIIRRALQAKLAQNPDVAWVLERTGSLVLRPDHRQSPNKTPAYEYHRMWMELRGAQPPGSGAGFLAGWSDDAKSRVAQATAAVLYGRPVERKVAVFDGDGTLWHADLPREFLEHQVHHRRLLHFEYSPGGGEVARLYATCEHDVSICIAQAAFLYVGLELTTLRAQAGEWVATHLARRAFAEQRALVGYLRSRGFEIWVVSGGPQWLAQVAAARLFDLPPERVIGVATRVVDGRLSAEIIPPVPFRAGKAASIEASIGVAPQIVVGNSKSDIPMLALATRLAIAVRSFAADHPGFHYRSEQRLDEEAARRGWLRQRFVIPR